MRNPQVNARVSPEVKAWCNSFKEATGHEATELVKGFLSTISEGSENAA